MKKISNRLIDIKNGVALLFKRIYSIISVISTLGVFSAVILFLFGKSLLGNVCDDDLTMQRIMEQIPSNMTISDVYMEDIHGVGNESMIILASDLGVGNKIANQLLVFDKVENGILNNMYNLFGYGSNYKCSYLFSLEYLDKDWIEYSDSEQSGLGFFLELEDVIDLTGDLSKEIIVKFTPRDEWGSVAGNGGYYDTGIFSYSYKKHGYFLLGTYPAYNDSRIPQRKTYDRNQYDKNEKMKLEGGLDKLYKEYFATVTWYDSVLVRTEIIFDSESHSFPDPHRYKISLFRPKYNGKKDQLNWEEIFCEVTEDYTKDCSKEFIEDFLETNSIDVIKWEN